MSASFLIDDSSATRGDDRDAAGATRRRFLRKGLGTTAAVAGAAAVLGAGDRAEAQFGNDVSSLGRHFREIQGHENDHVGFIATVLGGQAIAQPQFVNLQYGRYRDFAEVARIFETTGVKAYAGAAPIINQRNFLDAAARIALMEARHSGWLNSIFAGRPLSEGNESFESPLTPLEVAAAVAPFFVDQNAPFQLASAISFTPSDANDVAIFNFALALEFLEAEFYNVNVPRFFR